jgi:glycogen phosphorylase
MGLGRVEPQNDHEPFCMTVLALKLSRRANAVSQLARPRFAPHVGPPLALARGGGDSHRPHHQRRARADLARLADAAALRPPFPAGWHERMGEPEVWQNIHNVDPGELWETHNALKNLLLAFVRRRVSRQCRRRAKATRPSKPPATCSTRTC